MYTPPTGAENAVPGAVIRSATWNTVFTDLSAALTTLGGAAWVTNPPRTVAGGNFTVLTTDVAVFVAGNSPTIFLPAASLVTSPFKLIGAAGTVFGSANSKVIPSGTDKISGFGTITLTTNFQVATFYPLPGTGYVYP